jgi:hypothetical protein
VGNSKLMVLAVVILVGALLLAGAPSGGAIEVEASGKRTPTPAPDCGFVCQSKATARAICGGAFEDVANELWLEVYAFTESNLYDTIVATRYQDITPYHRGMVLCGTMLSVSKKENAPWISRVLGTPPRGCGIRCQTEFYINRFCPDTMKSAPGSSKILEIVLSVSSGNPIHDAFLTCAVVHDELLVKQCGWICEVDKEVMRVCGRHFARNPSDQVAYEAWISIPANRATVLAIDLPVFETAQLICDTLKK